MKPAIAKPVSGLFLVDSCPPPMSCDLHTDTRIACALPSSFHGHGPPWSTVFSIFHVLNFPESYQSDCGNK